LIPHACCFNIPGSIVDALEFKKREMNQHKLCFRHRTNVIVIIYAHLVQNTGVLYLLLVCHLIHAHPKWQNSNICKDGGVMTHFKHQHKNLFVFKKDPGGGVELNIIK
jgi:hypothetical protein